MAEWIWVLIPLTALGLGGFKEWLKFKSKQERLGTSTRELSQSMDALREALERSESERARLTERMQNIETIVTSQAWDALPEHRDAFSDGRSLREAPERETPSDAEKAERLARRMQV